jgi:hypothetical protein
VIANKWFRNGMALFAGTVAAVGIGPVIVTAISDLLPGLAMSPELLTTINAVAGMIVALFFLFWWRRVPDDSRGRPSAGLISKTVGVALLVSSLGWMLANMIDASNTSAWRYTRVLIAEPGISGRVDTEERLHYTQLTANEDYKGGGDLVALPASWRVWLTGGRAGLLVRVRQAGIDSEDSSRGDRGRVTVSAISDELSLNSVTVPVVELYDQWRHIEISLPRQVTEIRLNWSVDSDATQSDSSLDVSVLSVRPDYHFLWSMCTIIASSLLLSLAYLTIFGAREGSRTVPRQAIAGRPGRERIIVPGIAATLLFLIIGNAFVFWFVSQEETIYTWDTAGYWTSSRHVSEVLRGESSSASISSNARAVTSSGQQSVDASDRPTLSRDPLTSLVRNVRYSEYNITNNLPVAAAMVFLGGSRMVYELSLTNIYALLAVLVLLLALRDLAKTSASPWTNWWPIIPVLVVLSFVPFWVPLIRGYIGVCVVAVNLAVLWLYFARCRNGASLAILTSIGLLFVAGVLLQRWNAYWVVAFLFITVIDGVRQLFAGRRVDLDRIIRCFQVPLVSGFIAFAVLAVAAWPLLVTMATTDYADIYSAYAEHTSLLTAMAQLVRSFGLVLLLLLVGAAAYLVSRRSTRRLAVLLSIQLIVVFVHFSGTQTMGPHHLYVLMPGSFLILSIAAIELISDGRRRATIVGTVMLMLYIANGIGSGIAVFAPSGESLRAMLVPLVPDNRRIPLVRDDIDAFEGITAYIDSLVAGDPKIDAIYVLSSSQTLNVVHLRNLEASTGIAFNAVEKLLRSSEVDKRDGFPRQLLMADLVIVADPIQYNRRPSDQYVVGVPAQAMLEGTGIGAAFRKLPESFEFRDGVNVQIFKKEREISPEESASLSDKLRAIYPNRPNIYK